MAFFLYPEFKGEFAMPEKKKNAFAPFALRLSQEERSQLERDAGNMTLSAYVRSVLFNKTTPRKRKHKRPIKDHQILSQVLVSLGTSRISEFLADIYQAVNNGSLIVTKETEIALRDACQAIVDIRNAIFKALGLSNDT